MAEKILFVDDEPNVLQAYQRTLRKDFKIVAALGGREALELMESEGPFPVVVSDMNMPEMNGVQLLSTIKERYPDTVRLMLTGNADQDTAVSAINKGDVYRFLNKPCPPDEMISAVKAALSYHNLLKAEKELLENTVKGSIQAMVEILSIVSPKIFGHASAIKDYVMKCARQMRVDSGWELEAAALLGQIGAVTLPEELVDNVIKGSRLSEEDRQLFEKYPEIGAQLINKIPRLESISEIIRYQNKGFDGSGIPEDGVAGEAIPLGARILRPVLDLVFGFSGVSDAEALERLKSRAHLYDPQVIKALEAVVGATNERVVQRISVTQLSESMTIADDIVSESGQLLVRKGQSLSSSMIKRLINYCLNGLAPDKISVYADAAEELVN